MKTRNALATLAISLLASHLFTAEAQNYFAGQGAGVSNTTGTMNAFVGNESGGKNTTGRRNAFFGAYSGYFNNGNENSFFGATAGIYNTTGSYNNFFGYYAGGANTTGNNNSFFGRQAGFKNKTGSGNNFFGSSAGYANTTGVNNAYFGNMAGFNNATGKFNTFVGTVAGMKNTTGSGNTYLGEGTGGAISTGSDNVFVGFRAQNKWTGSSAGNVALGAHAAVNGTVNSAAIGFRAYVSASNALVLGAINGINGAAASTNVGIGTHAPAYRLHVQGEAAKPGSSAWTVASDKRLKRDVKDFKDGLAVLRQIRPVQYQYNGKAGMPTGREYVGVIAQEVEAVAPYMIHTFSHADSTGTKQEYLDFDATALPYIIINAIKEQQQALEAKDARLQTLAEELKALRKELEDLRQGTTGKPDGNAKAAPAPEGNGLVRKPSLLQNAPNPFGGSTVIGYQIPGEYRQAYLSVRNLSGREVGRFNLGSTARGEVTLDAGTFPGGTYLYQLWVDGRPADSKKMILTK